MPEPKGIDQAIALIQKENWADRPMTTGERVAVNMAVRHMIDGLYPCVESDVRFFTEDGNGRLFIHERVGP